MIDKKFDRVIFIGQSIGNVIANRLIKLNHMNIDKRVFISPVRKSFDDTIKHCDMVITGTKDKHLSDDDRQKLKKIVTGKLMIVEGADHSLEAEGIIDKSLEICMNVVKAIDDYVD